MSLRRLGLERIDLYYLHSGTATDAPFEEQVRVLAELKSQGLIRHIGLSNVTVEQFEAAREIVEITALTANYNLGTRVGSAHLAAAERAGVVFSPWGPTRFNGPNLENIRKAVDGIARRHGATPHQVALTWHLHRSPNTLPIPGTRTISHVDANNAASRLALSADEVRQLTDLTPERLDKPRLVFCSPYLSLHSPLGAILCRQSLFQNQECLHLPRAQLTEVDSAQPASYQELLYQPLTLPCNVRLGAALDCDRLSRPYGRRSAGV